MLKNIGTDNMAIEIWEPIDPSDLVVLLTN